MAKDFVPSVNKYKVSPAFDSPADWALIVLKDALPARPIATKTMTREELKAATLAGTIFEIGYGQERPYSPTAQRKCQVDLGNAKGLLGVQCLANFGYSGSPILAEINGIPTLIGIFSAGYEDTGVGFGASASQFEADLRDAIAADGPNR